MFELFQTFALLTRRLVFFRVLCFVSKFELLSAKAKTKDDAFADIENILNYCKENL